MLKSFLGLEPHRPEDVKWGMVSLLVLASEREYRYWREVNHRHFEEFREKNNYNPKAIDEWRFKYERWNDFAHQIRMQLIKNGWMPPEQRDDDYPKSKEFQAPRS